MTHSDLSSTCLGMLSGIFRISISTSPAWRNRSASCCCACTPIESRSIANVEFRIFLIVIPSSLQTASVWTHRFLLRTRSYKLYHLRRLPMRLPARFISVLLFFTAIIPELQARVVRVEITSRAEIENGKPFGAAGAYEKIIGRVYFAVDPANQHNRQIVDLEKAPRNAKGEVEFSADLYLLKPKDMAKGNQAVLFEVSNRGGRGILSIVNGREGEYGDGFLMREGYTIAWGGWEFYLSS